MEVLAILRLLILQDVKVDGTNLDTKFSDSTTKNTHLQFTNDVTMSNFSKQIKSGNGLYVNKNSVLHLVNCNTEDNHVVEILEYGRVWGTIDIVDSSANLGVIGYNYHSNNWLGNVSTDGNNSCDIYGQAEKGNMALGVDGYFNVTGPVKATLKDGTYKFILNAAPTFVDENSSFTITYGTNGTEYADGTVVVYGNSKLSEASIALANDGYNLVLDDNGDLVLQDKNIVTTFEGASIRLSGDEGFRFVSRINHSVADIGTAGVQEYGTLIIPTVVLGSNELTIAAATDGVEYGDYTVKAAQVKSTVNYVEGVNTTQYAAMLIGIPSANGNFYKTSFTVRPYMVMSDSTVVYGDAQTKSMYDVATALGEEYATEENVVKILSATAE
ncbi:MAG: hypothetical protein ACI4CT_03850 [Lachnospiraceae bacterium]